MTDNSLEFILGRMEGQLEGINREIKQIKSMMECQSEDCETCKKGIDDQFKVHENAITALKQKDSGDIAVRTWTDSIYTKIGIVSAIVFSIIALVWSR